MIVPDAMVLEEVTLSLSTGNSGYDMPGWSRRREEVSGKR